MLPRRGPTVRDLELPLPDRDALVHAERPEGMPSFLGLRPLKRWRYVGAYGPDLMVCVGDAHIGRVPQRWWAVAFPDGSLHGRTTLRPGGIWIGRGVLRVQAPGAGIDLAFSEDQGAEPVESVNASGARGHVWTRKQAGIPVTGVVELGDEDFRVDCQGVIDDTAGYHRRDTEWRWSAGVGRVADGRLVGWNLVAGVNDDDEASERTIWVDGRPRETARVAFAEDLSSISFSEGGELEFTGWATREHSMNLLVARSAYRQPFGTFAGELPGGLDLAEGYGVMEWHDVRW
jgi:uncharacterized protein DUF2804